MLKTRSRHSLLSITAGFLSFLILSACSGGALKSSAPALPLEASAMRATSGSAAAQPLSAYRAFTLGYAVTSQTLGTFYFGRSSVISRKTINGANMLQVSVAGKLLASYPYADIKYIYDTRAVGATRVTKGVSGTGSFRKVNTLVSTRITPNLVCSPDGTCCPNAQPNCNGDPPPDQGPTSVLTRKLLDTSGSFSKWFEPTLSTRMA